MRMHVVATGAFFSVGFLVLNDGSSPTWSAFQSLGRAEQAALHVAIKKLAESGRIGSQQRFKKLEGSDGIWEFKKHQHRFLGFTLPGKRFVIAQYQKKQGDKIKPSLVQEAEATRDRLLKEAKEARA